MTAALLGILLALQGVPDHPDKLKYEPLKFEVPDPAAMRVELSGGGAAYLLEDDAIPLVELQLFIPAGSFGEPAGKEGLAGFLGALMRTGGTKTRTPEEVDEELEFLAADLSVSLGDTYGTASLSILRKDLDKGLELLDDILKNPEFRQDSLDTLKAQALEGMRARNDSLKSIENREANLLFFGDYPVNRLATRASVDSITREDLAGFHAKFIHPSNFVVAVAGAFKRDEMVAKLEKLLCAGWPAGKGVMRPEVPKVTHAPKPGIYCFHKEGRNINQGRVTIGHMGIDVHNPDVQAIRVMSYILGAGGFSSRLMQKVRTEEGLAYDVGTDFRPGILHPLPFTIEFQSKSGTCALAAKLCLDEVARIREERVSEKELRDAQQFYLDGFPALFFSTPAHTVRTYAQAELLGIPQDYYRTYREKIAKLTPEEIQRVAREYLKPEKFAWVVVGDIATIKKGDEKRGVKLADLGAVTDVPLPDPLTLKRPPR